MPVNCPSNKIIKFDLLQLQNNSKNSMKGSFKQLSVLEPIPYPTLVELPSQHCILTLKEMDDRLNGLTLDIYAMFSVTQQIKNSLMHLNCSLDYFQKCGMRLMAVINCIFFHYGIDRYHFTKLLSCIKYCNSQWKRNLIRTLNLLNTYPSAHSIFVYKNNRNLYLWMMLHTNNTILAKMLNKLIESKQLNARSLKYLQHNHIFKFYENAYEKMIDILQEKQEETYLKILLINEFIKYILLFLNFCSNNKSRIAIFNRFFTVVQYACRIMKKFYSPALQKHIQDSLNIIKEGLKYYIDVLQRSPLNKVKIQQIKHIVRIINQAPFKFTPSQNISENAFALKLVIRILNNWKKIHSKAERIMHNTITRSTQQLSINQFAKKEKENNLKLKIDNGKIDQIKVEFAKLNKSRTHLYRRKSHSLKPDAHQEKNSTGGFTMSAENNIKIRKEIQGNISQFFTKLEGIKMPRSFSKERKRDLSMKKQNQQRELKIEDYSQHMQSRLKIVPNLNKIQLYRPEKMRDFCKRQPKLKIHATANII